MGKVIGRRITRKRTDTPSPRSERTVSRIVIPECSPTRETDTEGKSHRDRRGNQSPPANALTFLRRQLAQRIGGKQATVELLEQGRCEPKPKDRK